MNKELENKVEELETTEEVEATEEEVVVEAPVVNPELEELKEEVKKLQLLADQPVKKNIHVHGAKSTPKEGQLTREWVKGLLTNDYRGYEAVSKDNMTRTNTGAVLPPEEFVASVIRAENEVGVAARYATVRRTDRDTVRVPVGGNDVAIYETGEGASKTLTKLTYTPKQVSMRKYAAIAPLTDELLEDSAVNLLQDLSARFGRQYAIKKDELVFTDATSGILNLAGVNEVEVAGGFSNLTFDHLSEAVISTPDDSASNGRFYFHKDLLHVLRTIKADGQYIWAPGANGPSEGTIWGRPYSTVDVMPSLTDSASDTGFVIYGDLKRYTWLIERTGLEAFMSREATVVSGEESISAYQDDLTFMRVVQRMNAITPLASAMTVIKTAIVS